MLTQSSPPKTRDSLQLTVLPQGTAQLAYPPAYNATLPFNSFKLGRRYPDASQAVRAAPNLPLVFGPSQVDANGQPISTGGTTSGDLNIIMIMAIYVHVDGGAGTANGSSSVAAAGVALPRAIPLDIPCTPEDCAECFVSRDGMRFWGE